MKKLLPLLALVFAVGFAAKSLRPPKNETAFDVVGFSKLPVLVNGRLKPLDTVARSSLLQLQARQRVSSPNISEPLVASPAEWLLEVVFRPERADTFPTFAIDNPDLLTLVGKNEERLKIRYDSTAMKVLSIVGFVPSHHRRFSVQELTPHIASIQAQARLADPVEAAVRNPFQRAVMQLYHNLVHYQRLRHALVAPGREDFLGDLMKFQDTVVAGRAAVMAKMNKQPHDEAAAAAMLEISERFAIMAESTNFLVIPPPAGVTDPTAWRPAGAALLETFRTGEVNPSALAYAGFAHAWRNNKPEQFNKLLELFRTDLANRFGPQLDKCESEV